MATILFIVTHPYTLSVFWTATATVFAPLAIRCSIHFKTISLWEHLNLFLFNPLLWQVNSVAGFNPPISSINLSHRTKSIIGHQPSTAGSLGMRFLYQIYASPALVTTFHPLQIIWAGATESACVICVMCQIWFSSWANFETWKSSIFAPFDWVEVNFACIQTAPTNSNNVLSPIKIYLFPMVSHQDWQGIDSQSFLIELSPSSRVVSNLMNSAVTSCQTLGATRSATKGSTHAQRGAH